MIDWEFRFHCIISKSLRGCFWLFGVMCPEDWPDRSLLVRKHEFLGSALNLSFLYMLNALHKWRGEFWERLSNHDKVKYPGGAAKFPTGQRWLSEHLSFTVSKHTGSASVLRPALGRLPLSLESSSCPLVPGQAPLC